MNDLERDKQRICERYAENHKRFKYPSVQEIILYGASNRLRDLFVDEILGVHEDAWEIETEYIERRLEAFREKRPDAAWAALDPDHVISDINRMIADADELREMISTAVRENDADYAVELTMVFMELVCSARMKQIEPALLRDSRRIEREQSNMNSTREKMQQSGARTAIDEELKQRIKDDYKELAQDSKMSGRQIAKELSQRFGVSEATIYKHKPAASLSLKPTPVLTPKKAIHDPNIS